MRRVPKKRVQLGWVCAGCGAPIANNEYGYSFGHLAEDCVVVLFGKLEALTLEEDAS